MNKKPTYLRWLVGFALMLFIWGNSTDLSAQSMKERAKLAEIEALHGPTVVVPYSEGTRAIGDNCTTPIVVNIPADLPFADLGNTTCGRGNTYSNSDLGSYDGGEDIIYQLNVTSETEVIITMDPKTTSYSGLGLFTSCPTVPLGSGNYWTASNSGVALRTITRTLTPGTYYVMADTWAAPDCITLLDMKITQVLPPPPPAVVTVFPFIENFETTSTTRADWRQIQESGTKTWTFAAGSSGGAITSAFEGALNAKFTSSTFSGAATKLVTPPLDLSALAAPRLSFYLGQENWDADQNTTKVFYRISATAPWVELASYTNSIATWTMFDLELPNPSATYQIAFEGIDKYGRANVIDLVTVYNVTTTPGLEILNPTLTLGHRPIGAWMEPARLEIVNNPGAGSLSITAADIDNTYGGFVKVVTPALPFTLASGATTTEFGLSANVLATATAGSFTGQYIMFFGESRALASATYEGTAYVPVAGDVVENAIALPPAATATAIPLPASGNYKNYILPNDIAATPTSVDAVNKITPALDMLLNTTATSGMPVNFAVYAAGFDGEGGPMATNAMVQSLNSLVNVELHAGKTYYMVSSAAGAYTGTYTLANMPAPDAVTYVAPLDGAINITNGTLLSWTFGDNTSQYEVVLGTTYPPTTVVVPYTSNLATSFTLAGLQPNMQYFWRVNVKNTNGTTAGPVWGFTTTIDVPTAFTVTLVDPAPTAATVTANLNWTGPSDRGFIGYNVYRGATKLNTTPLSVSQYTDLGLARNTSYTYKITNVYDEGESAATAPKTVTTKGVGIVKGFVYDYLTNDPIEGARVDISGTEENYSLTTTANGAYSTQAYRGVYSITASATDYTSKTVSNLTLGHGSTVSRDFYLMETPYPVGEVVAFELNDNSVQVSWSGIAPPPPLELIKITQNPGAPENAYYQSYGRGYGVVYNLANYPDATINSMNFQHASWGNMGIWQYKIHVYNWDTKTLIGTYGPFSTTGNDKWEAGINLEDVSAGGASLVAILMEPLSYDPTEAYPNISSDDADYPQGSITGLLSNPAGMTPSTIGNFLMELYIHTAGGTRASAPRFVDFGNPVNEPNRMNTNIEVTKSVIEQTALSITKGEDSNTHRTVAGPSFTNGTRGIVSYDVWREKVYEPGTLVKIGNTVSEDFVDFSWGTTDWGVYRWAVTVNYDENQVSAKTFSNTLDKDMNTEVNVTVALNSGDSPAGTLVTFTNTSEPGLELVYEETLGGSGLFTWNMFRKGTYDIEVFKVGYTSISLTAVNILDETSFTWLLEEILAPPSDLYVTPTGYATWGGGSGGGSFAPLMADFNAGMPADWTIEAGPLANASGAIWKVVPSTTSRKMKGDDYVVADSGEAPYGNITHTLLVSPTIPSAGETALYVEFDQYYYYSTGYPTFAKVSVFNGSEWIIVLDQTASSGSWSAPVHKSLDVSAYANANFQVRFEYYGDWSFYWALDNISVTNAPSRNRSFDNYKVFHDGVLVTSVTGTEYQYGTNGEALVDGETYVAEVAGVYSTGQSPKASYTWTYNACENYATPGNFAAAQVEGTLNVNLTWTVPTIPAAEDQIDFARITRDGEVIIETELANYLDSGLDLGTYTYCITFVYESGAETCPATLCKTVEVMGGGFVNGNVKEAAYLGGANISGAEVKLTNVADETITFTFTTNASGMYTGEVLAGTYNYTVSAEGYVKQTLENIAIAQTATVTRNFVMMEFPYAVGDIVATEISGNVVEIDWTGNGGGNPGGPAEDFFEGFEAGTLPTGWKVYDVDSDGYNWENTAITYDVFDAHTGDYCMTSASYLNDIGPLFPNNWLVTPALAVTATSELKFWIDGQDPNYAAEKYYVKVSTTGNAVADFTTTLHTAFATPNWSEVVLDLSAYAGQSIYIAFQHNGTSDLYFIKLDDVTVTNTITRAAYTAPVAAGVSSAIPFRTSGMTEEMIQVKTAEFTQTNATRALQGFNVYRTTCATGDLQFLGYTLDSIFTDNTWGASTVAPGVYKWGVEAVYEQNNSEVSFSNCLDKDMTTIVSVQVNTNSGDLADGTAVVFTNTSEPELELVYSVTLDETGYYDWADFRKGTYDIHVEKLGFTAIEISDEIIDGAKAYVWLLEELLLPISDLHVSPTGYATWRGGGVIPFEPFIEDFSAGIDNWTKVPNTAHWEPSQTALAGGTSPEARFYWMPTSTDRFYFISPMMSTLTQTELELSFKHFVNHYTGDFNLEVVTIADGVEYPVMSFPAADAPAADVVTMLTAAHGIGAAEFQIAFVFDGNTFNIFNWNIDNVMVDAPRSRELEHYKVWLDGVFVDNTPNTFYQYDPATLIAGQEYFSEVAAVYSNGIAEKMNYTWTYFACDSFPGPQDLTYEVVDVNKVVLSWGGNTPPPPPPGEGFSDDFEGHTNFAIEFAPWTNVDVDGSTTYAMTGITWPNAYAEQSFIVFNPSATSPVLDGADAHSGNKYAACFASVDAPNNDWLISPSVAIGTGYKVSFWAKSYTADYGLERFKVGVSTTGLNPSDFTIITPGSHVEAPAANWTKFTYDLSAYIGQSVYVGIQCVSNDAFFLMVDDFSIGAAKANFAFNATSPANGNEVKMTRDSRPAPDYSMYAGEGEFVAEKATSATGIEIGFQDAQTREAVEIHYDNGYDNNAVGTGSAVTFMSAVRFTETELAQYYGDYELTDVKFIIHNPEFTNVTVKVWEGGSYGNPGTEVYSQDVTSQVTATTMTTATLTNAIALTAGKEYWIGYAVTVTTGHPAAVDAGPMVSGKGAWMYFNNAWDELTNISASLNYNWVIRGIINTSGGSTPGGSTFDPGEYLGANVYRDGELIAEMVQGETYSDLDVDPGYYDYCVTFVYEENAMSCMTTCVTNVLVTEDCVVPTNLTATVGAANQVALEWNNDSFGGAYLSYGDLIYSDAIGVGGTALTAAIQLDPAMLAQYDGKVFSKIKMYYGTGPIGDVTIQIWEGTTLVREQAITSTIVGEAWNEFTFNQPILINGTKSYKVGYTVANYTADGFPGGAQDYMGNPNSDVIFFNGAWDHLNNYLPYSWLIEAYVSSASKGATDYVALTSKVMSTSSNGTLVSAPSVDLSRGNEGRSSRSFLGYNIYKNGSLFVPLWPETTYVYQEGQGGETCYTVTAEYEFCGETDPSNIACVTLVDVKSTDLSQIRVYPNPSNSTVNIKLTNNVSQVVIYNYLGQVVLENNITDQTTLQIDVRNYEAGAYLVKFVTSEGQSITKKVVVTK